MKIEFLQKFKIDKQSTIVQITGLVLGIVTCIFIFRYAFFEYSFDRFHKNKDLIYRTQSSEAMPLGPLAKEKLSYVKEFARLHPCYRGISVQTKDNAFIENQAYYSDGSIFEILSFPIIAGDAPGSLTLKDHLVISESYAKKYFGNQNPIGQTVQINGAYESGRSYTIGAVFEDIPSNSHIKFDILLSIENILSHNMYSKDNPWQWSNFFTYFRTRYPVKKESFVKNLSALAKDNGALLKNGQPVNFPLFALKEIHLNGQTNFMDNNANARDINILIAMGMIILIISWINYINISVGSALKNKLNLGVKKVLGANSLSLWGEIFKKMLVLNTVAIVASLILYFILKPLTEKLVDGHLSLTVSNQILFWLIITGIQLFGTCIVSYSIHGLQNRQNLISLLSKRNKSVKGKQSWISLFVFQFSASIILICFAFFSSKQVNELMHVTKGIKTRQILALRSANVCNSGNIGKSRGIFEDEVVKLPDVEMSTSTTYIPGERIASYMPTRLASDTRDNSIKCFMNFVGYDYIPLFGHKLIAGRNFSREFSTDGSGIIINKTLANEYGFHHPKDAIGKEIYWETKNTFKTIIGVMDDFHQQSADVPVEPTIYHLWDHARGYCVLSVESTDLKATIKKIENLWNRIHSGNAFEYLWIDEQYNKQFHKWIKYSNVINIFSFIAILIACIGLFGLSSMMLLSRTKEIGVRKVNGARNKELVLLLNRQFVKWVIVAFFIACPISWFIIDNWLSNFAYRTNLSWWVFVLSGAIALLIAFLTVSLKTFRAARANPVVALRYE